MTNKKRVPTKPDQILDIPSKLKILSWNINDLSDSILGKKFSNQDFLDTLSPCDIFCLQETNTEFKIPNFRCFNTSRTNSRSGGLCLGVRRELSKYVTLINTAHHSSDIQAVKISPKFTGYDENVILINIYDSPENSSYKMNLKSDGSYKETLSILNELHSKYE